MARARRTHRRLTLYSKVSGGYPPKPFTDDSKSLQAAGIRHGDTVNVTLIDSALTATAAAATAPSPISQKMEPAPTSQSNAYPGDIEAVETTGGYLVLRVKSAPLLL